MRTGRIAASDEQPPPAGLTAATISGKSPTNSRKRVWPAIRSRDTARRPNRTQTRFLGQIGSHQAEGILALPLAAVGTGSAEHHPNRYPADYPAGSTAEVGFP